jgi:hypothetical protein
MALWWTLSLDQSVESTVHFLYLPNISQISEYIVVIINYIIMYFSS